MTAAPGTAARWAAGARRARAQAPRGAGTRWRAEGTPGRRCSRGRRTPRPPPPEGKRRAWRTAAATPPSCSPSRAQRPPTARELLAAGEVVIEFEECPRGLHRPDLRLRVAVRAKIPCSTSRIRSLIAELVHVHAVPLRPRRAPVCRLRRKDVSSGAGARAPVPEDRHGARRWIAHAKVDELPGRGRQGDYQRFCG
jgi:hypothetical protein